MSASAARIRWPGRRSVRSTTFGFFTAPGVLLAALLSACSAGEQAPDAADLDPLPAPDPQLSASVCDGSDTGCPCADEGASSACGSVAEQRGDYVICAMGTRTCGDGVWSDCAPSASLELQALGGESASRGLRLQALSSAENCKNLCDPQCMAVADNPSGLVVDDDLLADPGGLTLPGGSNIGSCSDVSIFPPATPTLTVTISQINANGSVVATPSPLALSASCAGGAPIQPSWTMDAYDRAVINGTGSLTVFSGIASPILVTAASSADTDTRLVDVVVRIEDRGSNATVATALDGSGSADTGTASKTLYPYKNTVFPLDLEAPLVQWDPGSNTATAVKVALRYPAGSTSPSFYYSKIYNTEPKQGTVVTTVPAWKIPQEIWSAFDRSAAGSALGGEIIVQRYYSSAARTAMKIPVKFATASLSGTVYYTQYLRSLYSSASSDLCGSSLQADINPSTYTPGNVCPVGLCTTSLSAGGATTRGIDLSKPLATNKDPFNGTAGCPVCHSVSANGKRYVSVNQAQQTIGGATSKGIDDISLDSSGNPMFTPVGTTPTYTGLTGNQDVNGEASYGFAFGALSPDGSLLLHGPGYWGNTLDQPSTNNTQDGTMKGITTEMKPYFFANTNRPGAGVQFATTAALPLHTASSTVLTASANGQLSIDGVAMANGYAVLVKDETLLNAPRNGVYTVTAAGSSTAKWTLTRRTDMDNTTELLPSVEVRVSDGNANRGRVFYMASPTSSSGFTVGTTAINFSLRAYPAIQYTASPVVAKYATAATLPAYAASGDVLTASSNGPLSVDGQPVALNEVVLVKNETGTSQKNNGVYTLTQVGSLAPAAKWKLTRHGSLDSVPNANADALPGLEVKVTNGTYAGTVFTLFSPITTPITINTASLVFRETVLPAMMVPVISPDGSKVAYINADGDPLPGSAVSGWRRGLSLFNFDQSSMTVSAKKRLLNTYSPSSTGMPIKWPFFEPDSRSLLYVKTDPNEYCSASADDGKCAVPVTDTYAAASCTADSAVNVNSNLERSCYQGSRGSMTATTRGFWPGRIYSIDSSPTAPATPASTEVDLQKLNNGDDDGGLDDATDAGKSYQPTVLPFSVGGYRWVIFTSPRPYGNQFNQKGTHFSCGASMLWVSAIKDTTANGTDRSNPAFFLPGQKVAAITTLNHYVNERGYLVPSLCKAAGGSCNSNADCCGGTGSSPTAACRAPTSWTPASGPPAKTCATLSGTCSNAGQSCSTPADCCNGASCVDFKCAAPPVYEAADFTREYAADCPDSYQPRWQLLSYYLTTEGDSRLEFRVQTANQATGLDTATLYDVGQSTNDVVSPATPDFKDVGAVLDTANANGKNHLRLTVSFIPSSDGKYAPILHDWEMRYRCEAAQ